MTIAFTSEMCKRLWDARNRVLGTTDYLKYDMECTTEHTTKANNHYWNFIGWGLPYHDGVIKKYRDRMYIITVDSFGCKDRFVVNEAVKTLLNL